MVMDTVLHAWTSYAATSNSPQHNRHVDTVYELDTRMQVFFQIHIIYIFCTMLK